LLVEERLLEAEYFADLMRRQGNSDRFGFGLNAFVSSARSVTFLIQKELSHIPSFAAWWGEQQQLMRQDRAARFFLTLRNYSQKEGRISIAGTRTGLGGRGRWTYRFAGTQDRVPPELLQRDVVECCVEHLAKLARLVLACTEQFPFHTCPQRAMTPEGIEALRLSVAGLGAALGFDEDWITAGDAIPIEHQLRILRGHVDGLDFATLRRLSRKRLKAQAREPDASEHLGDEVLTTLVNQLERERRVDTPTLAGEMILRGQAGHE
jgi:hypothetical protein